MLSEIEYEIKSPIEDAKQVEPLLAAAIGQKSPTTEVDTYYDDVQRTLYRNGVFFRLRNELTVQIKAAPPAAGTEHLWCNEFTMKLNDPLQNFGRLAEMLSAYKKPKSANPRSFTGLLESFSLTVLTAVRKYRMQYLLEGAELAIDHVTGLGLFAELEIKDPSKYELYSELAKQCGLTNLPVGYVELTLRNTEPETYWDGRYLLPSDRVYKSASRRSVPET